MTTKTSAVFTVDLKNETKPVSIELSLENKQEKEDHRYINLTKKFAHTIKNYLVRFKGLHKERPKRLTWDEYFWAAVGSFISTAVLAFFHYKLLRPLQLVVLIGSLGASAVILFVTPHSPVAQPRNLIGGHIIGAVCGCIVRLAIDPFENSIASAVALTSSIFIMQLTETLHPPGGATALIAVTINPMLRWRNFLFILMPTLTGAIVTLIMALLINNLVAKRTYPAFWW